MSAPPSARQVGTEGRQGGSLPRASRGLLRDGAVVLSGVAGGGLWKLLALWFIASSLGPVVQGGFTLLMSVISFGSVVFVCGLDYANAFLVGREPARRLAATWNSLWLAMATLVLTLLWAWAALALFPQAREPFGASVAAGVGLVAVSIALMSFGAASQATAVGAGAYHRIAVINFATGAAWAVGAAIAVRVSYIAVLGVWAISLAVMAWMYMRLHGASVRSPRRVDWGLLQQQLGYGIRTLPGGIARSFNMRVALYFTAFYLAPTDVGVYGVLISLAETMLLIPNALSQVILGSVASQHDRPAARRRLDVATMGVGTVAAVSVLLVGRTVLGAVFGPAYAIGAPALAILILAATAHALGLFRIHVLYGEGNPVAATRAQLMALALTALGGVLLVPRLGMVGAALSTLITYVGFTSYLMFMSTRRRAILAVARRVGEAGVSASRRRVLFVGAFAEPKPGRIGGIQIACRALAASSFGRRCDLMLLDGTALRVPPPALPIRAVLALRRCVRFLRLLIGSSPDSVLIFASSGVGFVEKGLYVLTAAAVGTPTFLWMRSGDFLRQCRESRVVRLMTAPVLRAATALVCQGNTWATFYQEVFRIPRTRTCVIENWLADEGLFSIAAMRSPKRRSCTLLFVGWLYRPKGVFELLQAVAELAADPGTPPFRVVFAGQGNDAAALKAEAAVRGVAGRVSFPGWLLGDALREAFADADIFVLPSWSEGFPNAMVEAMATGLPPVVTSVGAVPDVVTDGVDGLLVPVRDPTALRDALRCLIADEGLRGAMGQAAHATATRRFRVERAADQLVHLMASAGAG